MFGYVMVTCLVVLGVSLGNGDLAWSESSPAGEDKGFQVSDKNQEGTYSTDQSQLFSPVKPTGEESFLILNPDGNTTSDYQKFLTPLDQLDKKPGR